MATCTPDLLSDASCLTCLNDQQLLAIIACQLATQNGMSCDPAILLADASCLTCLNPQQLLAVVACQLASGGGGGGGGAGITYASGVPVDGVASTTWFYIDSDTNFKYYNTGTLASPVWIL